MSYSGKKFTWKNVSEMLSDKQLKSVTGGSGSSGNCYQCWSTRDIVEYGSAGDCANSFDFLDLSCAYGFVCGPCSLI